MQDATDLYRMWHPSIPPERGAEWCPRNYANLDNEAGLDRKTPVYVYANHGRWIAECECNSAQLACRTDHRFMCHGCFNAAVGGKWRVAVWPDAVDEIAAILDARPAENANWLPGESLADLAAEHPAGV